MKDFRIMTKNFKKKEKQMLCMKEQVMPLAYQKKGENQ